MAPGRRIFWILFVCAITIFAIACLGGYDYARYRGLYKQHQSRSLLSTKENPMEKEFEENRQTYLEQDKERILKKLDNVLSSMKSDPSLGFPVVKPKPNENKIIRHILIYNRLSPPNSLRCGEFSSKNEFYAWIDQSPGRQNKIELTLQSRSNVQFPNTDLLSSRKFDREEINEMQFEELEESIKLIWNGVLSVRSMRMDIPVIISFEARENEDAEFYVKEPIVYKAKNSDYKYEVFAKPRVIRWKVGPSVPVMITVNNNKPIRPAVPDGRNRKFKIKFHNNLMNKDEYISFFIGPLIDELEAAPLTYFYGLDIQSRITSEFSGKWAGLTDKRADKDAPYFQYERYWPWTLCAHLELIPADKYQLSQIANSIPKIKAVWDELSEEISSALSMETDNKKKKKMKKHVQQFVCDPVDETFCRNDNADGPLTKQQKINVRCGVWPEKYTFMYKGNEGGDNQRTLRYKIHPIVPEKTAITMVFGYFPGIKDGKTAKYNDRFHRPNSFYLSNSFMYVSNIAGNKMLRVSCSIKADIDENKCCKVSLPFKSFNKKNVEREFDLLVISASDDIELLSYPSLFKDNPRLSFRKGLTKTSGRLKVTERFCYKPKAYGRYQIRFEIVAACKTFGKCQKLGEKKVGKIGTAQDKTNVIAPKDFQIPPPLSVIVPQFKLKDIKIVTEGSGQGDIIEVINQKWFKLRIFFLGGIKGKVVITPNNKRFSFKPKSIVFNDGDLPFGSIKARAEIDCPSATRIMVVNYQVEDELLMWDIPNPTLLQIAPNPQNIEEVHEVTMDKNDSVLCNIPDDFCMEEGVICGTKNEIAKESMCVKYPKLCDEPLPPKPKPDVLKLWILYVLYACVGLLVFTIIYRNCCGGDGKAMALLMNTMKDLNKDVNNKPLPKDAIQATNFLRLAGLDESLVFSADNPNPMAIAEAQLSLEKMLKAMKKR
eukprot:169132_1